MFISGYLSKNAEKRRQRAFGDLLIPYLIFHVFVGICMLVLTRSGSVLQNPFLPQMGAWYLLSLFCYRLLLPELGKIKGVMFFSVLLTVFTCLMTGIGAELALGKTFGFLVFFLAGYFAPTIKRLVPKNLARFLLLVICVTVVLLTKWIDYDLALSILSRGANIKSFGTWYVAPILYFIVFILSTLIGVLVLSAVPEKSGWLENQGKDTMPMYLSHLVLFMAAGYLVNKDNCWIAIGVSFFSMILSIILFSRSWYRKVFNSFLKLTNRIFKVNAT